MPTFFKSEKVKVFPCSYRGYYNDPETNGQLVFNPTSRMINEENFINHSSLGNQNDTYIISYAGTGHMLYCVIAGYYFEIDTADIDLDLTNKYLCVKISDYTGSSSSTIHSKVLDAINVNNNDTNLELDQKVTIKGNTYYEFRGLGIYNSQETIPVGLLGRLLVITEDGSINTKAFLSSKDLNGNFKQSGAEGQIPKQDSGNSVQYAAVFGKGTVCDADAAFATGINSEALGIGSFATGNSTKTGGTSIEGSGLYAFAEGNNTVASGKYSHAQGTNTVASEEASFAGGINTIANGKASIALGINTEATKEGQTVIGKYNSASADNSLFVIGNGTETTKKSKKASNIVTKSNAVEVTTEDATFDVDIIINKPTSINDTTTITTGTKNSLILDNSIAIKNDQGTEFEVTANGNTKIAGTIETTGKALLKGGTDITGNITITSGNLLLDGAITLKNKQSTETTATDKFTVDATTGKIYSKGNIENAGNILAGADIQGKKLIIKDGTKGELQIIPNTNDSTIRGTKNIIIEPSSVATDEKITIKTTEVALNKQLKIGSTNIITPTAITLNTVPINCATAKNLTIGTTESGKTTEKIDIIATNINLKGKTNISGDYDCTGDITLSAGKTLTTPNANITTKATIAEAAITTANVTGTATIATADITTKATIATANVTGTATIATADITTKATIATVEADVIKVKDQTSSKTLRDIFDIIYPIGSVYISFEKKNPKDLFNFGTWEQLKQASLWAVTNTSSGRVDGSLPNITGWFQMLNTGSDHDTSLIRQIHGAFDCTHEGDLSWDSFRCYDTNFKTRKAEFDASKSCKLYGNGQTTENPIVKPTSYEVFMWKRTA